MMIKVFCKDYDALRKEIRKRASNHEWSTWDTVEVTTSDGTKVKRLIHTPPNDDQYKVVQIKLYNPPEKDKKKNPTYLQLIPEVTDKELTKEQAEEKVGMVMGRFCEILNRYFPTLKEYHVLL